jgi:type IV secretion system protein TrbE
VQFHKKVKRLIRRLQPSGGPTRISREGMPNGFCFNDLLWFGDGGSQQTAVSRGFLIEPAEMDSMDEEAISDQSDRLRHLLAALGDEYTLQARYMVCSDYSEVLARYKGATDAIADRWQHRWQIWNRTERCTRYMEAMMEGKLRRELLALFFTRVIDSEPSFSVSEQSLEEHFNSLAARESLGFAQVQGDLLHTLFPDCRVSVMGDREHYLHYYRFLNPSCGASIPDNAFEWYDPARSIQENCLFGDLVQPPVPGVSFQLDGLNHAILVMRQLPKRMGPGLVTRILELGFQDYEITLNLYPQKTSEVVKTIEKTANQLQGEVLTQPKRKYSLSEQLAMAKERIADLERGNVVAVNVFFVLRLWHRDADTLISRATIARNAFASMAGATCHYATNAETARQLWYQTWPGWTFGTYRGYDLPTDDQTAAELLPWSATFTGRLDGAEALYDSPKGGLVGLSTQIGRVPQHMLIFGVVGAGKSILLTDLWAQIAHNFGYILVVEEGLSHGTTVQTAGARPIVITPGGTTTINYLDTCGLPLTSEHLGGAVALCLQMLRENTGKNVDQARISGLQSILTNHISLLYDSAWEEWSRTHAEEANLIARRAYWIEAHRQQMPGEGNSFLDAWSELRDVETAEVDEYEVAKFATHHLTRSIVCDLGMSYLSPEEMPTHSELVELMTLTPIGGYDDNSEAVKIGDRLSVWKASGPYGKLFDGVTTSRLDQNVTHFELGLIPDSMEEMRDAAHFLVLNVARQQVIKRPRAQRKFIIFEEGARMIQLPGGAKALKEFYAQMRKYGAVVCSVFQQATALQTADKTLRAAVFDNTKLLIVSAQPSPRAVDEIGESLELSESAKQAVKRYPLPEQQTGQKFSSFLMVAPDPRRKLVGTFRNIATPEVVYAGASDNEIWDGRQKALLGYDDIVTGIIKEARKHAN